MVQFNKAFLALVGGLQLSMTTTTTTMMVAAFVGPSMTSRPPFVSVVSRHVALMSSEPETTSEVDEVTAAAAATTTEAEPAIDSASALDDILGDVMEASSEAASDDVAPAPAQQKHAVYLGNLPFTTTENDIRTLFAENADGVAVESISMPTNVDQINEETGTPLSKGFCFVDVATSNQVQVAIDALNQIEYNGRKIRVNKMMSKEEAEANKKARGVFKDKSYVPEGLKKLYIGNLDFGAAEEDITDLFSQYGEITDVYVPRRDGSTRGFAFVTMAEDDADKAMQETDGMDFMGRNLVVNEPLKEGEKQPRRSERRNKQFKMYVGNLSFFTSKETLQEIFEEFGEVYDCYLPVDSETNRVRGFGFVSMEREAGEAAIAELDGMELDDRVIRVNEAQGKKRRSQEDTFGNGDDF